MMCSYVYIIENIFGGLSGFGGGDHWGGKRLIVFRAEGKKTTIAY
jgi:hypothetical protein